MSSDKAPLLKSKRPSRSQGSYQLGPSHISFPSSSTSALAKADDEGEDVAVYEQVTSSEGGGMEGRFGTRSPGDLESGGRREGIPKLSRECLWSEIKCYGSYILPVILLFGVLAIGISLGIYGKNNGWFGGH